MKAVFNALAAGAFEFEEDKIKESMENIRCNALAACWDSNDEEPEYQSPAPQ